MQESGLSVITASLGAFTLAACVTINIYFPAAAAERAADRIIDEILQTKPESVKPQAAPPAAPK